MADVRPGTIVVCSGPGWDVIAGSICRVVQAQPEGGPCKWLVEVMFPAGPDFQEWKFGERAGADDKNFESVIGYLPL